MMDRKKISAALEKLTEGDSSRSETAKIRDVIDDIENALNSGVSREAIFNELKKEGLTLTFASFKNSLHRIRKSRVNASSISSITGGGNVATTEKVQPDTTPKSKRSEREKVADRFMGAESTNPLINRFKNKGNTDENSSN